MLVNEHHLDGTNSREIDSYVHVFVLKNNT